MENVKNISRIIKLREESYLVKVELYDEWNDIWETVYYGVNFSDPAPINKFLKEEIKSGNYDSIMVIRPPYPEVEDNKIVSYDPETNEYIITTKPNSVNIETL